MTTSSGEHSKTFKSNTSSNIHVGEYIFFKVLDKLNSTIGNAKIDDKIQWQPGTTYGETWHMVSQISKWALHQARILFSTTAKNSRKQKKTSWKTKTKT